MKQSNNKTIKYHDGFTLIETIIYMGLLAVILLTITNLFITTSYFFQEEAVRLEIQKNGRFAMERIIRDLQVANSISIPVDSNPIYNLVIDDISYQLSNGRLQRSDTTSTENVTSNQVKIDSLQFTRIQDPNGQPTIKIEVNVNYIGQIEGQRDVSQDFETSFYLK